MEIHQLRYFCAVVKCSSFTKAAKQENVSQPSLSQQIIKLELELGAKLFDRFKGHVGLTSAGETLYAKAQSILEQISNVGQELRDTSGTHKGTLVLGVSPNLSPDFLPERLARFTKKHPHVAVRVVEDVTSVLIEYLREGLLNLALVVLPLDHAIAGPDLSSVQLTREPLYVAVPANHPMAEMKPVTLKDIREERFIFLKDGRCYSQSVASAFRRAKLHPNVIAESASIPHVLAMVGSGIGVSVVPEHAILSPRVDCRFLPISGEDSYSQIGQVKLKERSSSAAQRVFVEFLRQDTKRTRRKSARAAVSISLVQV